MKYRKRPAEIDALRFDDAPTAAAWLAGHGFADYVLATDGLMVRGAAVTPGDWIVRDEEGAIAVCSPCVFDTHYEAVI